MLAALLLPLAIQAGCASRSDGGDQGQLLDTASGADWPGAGRSFGEQHFSPLDQLNSDTIGRLGLAWSFDLPIGNSVSQPIAVGGVVYTATGYSVVRAINATDGKLLWQFDPGVAQVAGAKMRNAWGIRGLAWWNETTPAVLPFIVIYLRGVS